MAVEWTTAIGLAARIGNAAYGSRHYVQQFFKQAQAYLDMGRTQVVVTGSAGAGKTMLRDQVHGRARALKYEEPEMSTKPEVDAIKMGDWTKLIRVLPGQSGYRTHGEIEALQNNSNLEGVIHVVDYGYSQPREKIIRRAYIEQDKLSTIASLREANLKSELLNVQSLCTDIRRLAHQHQRPKWLILAVNKVDLFTGDRDNALDYYHPEGTGAFGAQIANLRNEIGQKNLGVYVIETCADEKDFSWNKEEIASSLKKGELMRLLNDFAETLAMISTHHA